jgi:hypothetical protein
MHVLDCTLTSHFLLTNTLLATPPVFLQCAGSRHSMFYVEVDDSMRAKGSGGGLDDTGESIEILALPLKQADGFIFDDMLPKSPGLMFGLMWLQQKLGRSTA